MSRKENMQVDYQIMWQDQIRKEMGIEQGLDYDTLDARHNEGTNARSINNHETAEPQAIQYSLTRDE